MTETNANEAPIRGAMEKGLLCAKCEHLNPGQANVCESCGSHLHVTCQHCGERNPRTNSRCRKCRKHLHHSFFKKYWRKMFRRQAKVKPLHVLLLVIAVYITYKIIIRLAEYQGPDVM